MMTLQTLTLILATIMAIVAVVGWSRYRQLISEFNKVKSYLETAKREKENFVEYKPEVTVQKGVSESTVLALAGEISRLENNLVHMEDVPGRKQLQKGVERMKSYLQAENYIIVPLLGAKYTEGMMASAVFVHDDRIPKGEAQIISVQLPQINYCGKMIQSAKVTVGQNME